MKRSLLITGGILTLVLLLGGSAFVGGRLFGTTDLSSEHPDQIVAGSGDVKVGSGVAIDVEYAAEMPDFPADVFGLYVRREDNSLFVGTGTLSGVIVDGKIEQHHDGPVVEIVITHDTQIYRDDMLLKLQGVAPSGPVQQVLKPGSMDEMGPNCTVQAWGQRRGERLVAELLVFTPNQ